MEWTIRAMDEAGVRRALLCACVGPAGPLISNDAVAAAVARYPDRFDGVASVDLAAPMLAVRELRGQLAQARNARLALAAAGAQDGQLIQFLAGAPELLARYRSAPPAAISFSRSDRTCQLSACVQNRARPGRS